MRARWVVGCFITGSALVGCGTADGVFDQPADEPSSMTSPADPRVLFEHIVHITEQLMIGGEPQSVDEILASIDTTETHAEGAVVGRIRSVTPGVGYIYSDVPTEEEVREVDFADPNANAQSLTVTLEPEIAIGDGVTLKPITMQVGVLSGFTAEQMAASLLGIGKALYWLDTAPDGPDAGNPQLAPLTYLGHIADDDTMTFPARRVRSDFGDDYPTLKSFLEAAELVTTVTPSR